MDVDWGGDEDGRYLAIGCAVGSLVLALALTFLVALAALLLLTS